MIAGRIGTKAGHERVIIVQNAFFEVKEKLPNMSKLPPIFGGRGENIFDFVRGVCGGEGGCGGRNGKS